MSLPIDLTRNEVQQAAAGHVSHPGVEQQQPEPQAPSPASQWLAQLERIVAPLGDLADRLSQLEASMPDDPAVLQQAAALLRLRLDEPSPSESIRAAKDLTACWTHQVDNSWRVLRSLCSKLVQASLADQPMLIRPSDFTSVRMFATFGSTSTYVAARIADLVDPGHLLAQVPESELFESQGEHLLILGKAVVAEGRVVAADYYQLEDSIRITQEWVRGQANQRQKAAQEESIRQGEEAAKRALDQLQRPALERRVAAMEQLLKLKNS